MEWRQQSTFSCADAFNEAQRWIEEVTGKHFGCSDFRAALENGVLLCDLINQLKPGIIKKLNRHSTPIAGLDNVNVFLKACEKLGLNESQLFHPGDLQDLSTRATLRRNEGNRRLKNVLITVYWLGRKSHLDEFYSGPQLNFKAFEGLLGLALSKALDEGTNVFVKDGVYSCHPGKWPSYKRENSVDSIDSAESRAIHTNSEGCGSDAEAEQVFRMETTQQLAKGHIPTPLLQRKRGEESGKGCSTSFIRSKSLSDIPMVYPARKVSEDDNLVDERKHNDGDKKLKSHVPARDSEAHWQDDLTKWKNRRRSTNSDVRRKSLDREHVINKMTNGSANDHEEKGNRMQLKRDQLSPQRHSLAPRTHSTSPPSKCSGSFFRPHARAPLARSYATEVPLGSASSHTHQNFSPTQASSVGTVPDSNGNIVGEETHFSSLALNGTTVTTPTQNNPFSSQTQFKSQGIPAPFDPTTHMTQAENSTAQMSSSITTMLPNEKESSRTVDLSDTLGELSDKRHKFAKESHSFPRENAENTSKSQPASGTRKYLARAASWSCSASLPRGFRRSEGSCRLSSVITARPFGTSQSRMSTLQRLSDVKSPTENQGPISISERGECVPVPASSLLKRQTATAYLRSWHQDPMQTTNQTVLAKEAWNSLPDQTFQTNGFPHQSQTYLNMQPQRSQLESLQRNVDIPKVDCRYMSVSLALKPNSPHDFGFQPHWDATGARIKYIQPGGPAELCQLCVDDEIVTVDGVAAAHMSSGLWEEKMASALQSGTLTMDICRYVNKGGSESAISDLQVPSISPSSSSWSWDREDHRRRQEKWQKEQERLLQEQYEQDQQRLDTEWQKAQHAAVEGENNMEIIRGVHVNGLTNTEEQRPQELSTHDGSKKDQNGKIMEDWAEGFSDFAPLSPAHRTKSLSTPALGGPQKQQKGDPKTRKGEAVSKAEQERQQILEEMKKRTQLLTDNSWIRQRSSSFYKEPIYIGMPLKRYESLDILETSHSTSMAGYPRPHSAAASYCGPIRNSPSASSRYTTGSMTSQRNTSTVLHPGSVWAANSVWEKQRMVSRFVSDTRSHTVSPAISSLSPPVPHPCDQEKVLMIAD
uniref:LIM domain only protein 7-like isoform X2 n=1 Tax=Doryrhamphus excisus TaxID=161450 RepID=UPI0025AE7A65|nr:LIM domain only protein 7-like isoform X2 [Doryrhamphus excisus]